MLNKKTLNRKGVIVFILLSYLLFWGSMYVNRQWTDLTDFWTAFFGFIGPYSPLLAAIFTRFLFRDSFKDMHLRVNIKVKYWLLALFLPVLWNAFQDIAYLAFGYYKVESGEILNGLYRVPVNLIGGIFIFIGEEFGWRSYLVEKLKTLPRQRILLISGIAWAFWHLPLLVFQDMDGTKLIFVSGILLTLLVYVLLGYIFGWLYLESKSVWPCVLMHSYNNLIHLNLFNADIIHEPSMLMKGLIGFISIFTVWFVLYRRGKFNNSVIHS